MKGTYIVFEGIVGSGKTTQSKKLFQLLKERYPDRDVILTREPGGDEIGESIRKIVQATEFVQEMTPECEAYLYAAARAQTLRTVVKPVLEKGGIVISDRSFLTSAAYQGYARGLGLEKVLEINKHAVGALIPNIVIFIDVNPKLGLARCFDDKGDKFEKEDESFFRKIILGYDDIAKKPEFKDSWVKIDGSGDIPAVFLRITKKITDLLH